MAEGYTKLDLENLETRLDELDSDACITAERECRKSADPTPDLIYSSVFCAKLAAAALEAPYAQIKALKMPVFVAVVERTRNFLLKTLAGTVIPSDN